jgi:hypothetical protein
MYIDYSEVFFLWRLRTVHIQFKVYDLSILELLRDRIKRNINKEEIRENVLSFRRLFNNGQILMSQVEKVKRLSVFNK